MSIVVKKEDSYLDMSSNINTLDIVSTLEIFKLVRRINRIPVDIELDAAIIREEVQRIVIRKEQAYRIVKDKYPGCWWAYTSKSEYQSTLNMIYICLNNYPRDQLKKLKMLVGNKF